MIVSINRRERVPEYRSHEDVICFVDVGVSCVDAAEALKICRPCNRLHQVIYTWFGRGGGLSALTSMSSGNDQATFAEIIN